MLCYPLNSETRCLPFIRRWICLCSNIMKTLQNSYIAFLSPVVFKAKLSERINTIIVNLTWLLSVQEMRQTLLTSIILSQTFVMLCLCLFVLCPCQRQSDNDGRGALSLLLHHCFCITWARLWAWHTVARCVEHKSSAHMQEYVSLFTKHMSFWFRWSH